MRKVENIEVSAIVYASLGLDKRLRFRRQRRFIYHAQWSHLAVTGGQLIIKYDQ